MLVIGGTERGKKIDFSHQLLVGRGSNVDWPLLDSSLSRRHCQFIVTAQGTLVHDLGSTNGVFVNNVKITESHSLQDGDQVRLGALQLVFYRGNNEDIKSVEPVFSSLQSDSTIFQPPKVQQHEQAQHTQSFDINLLNNVPSFSEPETTINLWLDQFREKFMVQRVALFAVENDRSNPKLIGFSSGSGHGQHFSLELLELAKNQQSLLIKDAKVAKEKLIREEAVAYGFSALGLFPIRHNGQLKGMFYFDGHQQLQLEFDNTAQFLKLIIKLFEFSFVANDLDEKQVEHPQRRMEDHLFPEQLRSPLINANYPIDLCFRSDRAVHTDHCFFSVSLSSEQVMLIFVQIESGVSNQWLAYLAGLLSSHSGRIFGIEDLAALILVDTKQWLVKEDSKVGLMILQIENFSGDAQMINMGYQTPWLKRKGHSLQPFGFDSSGLINLNTKKIPEIQRTQLESTDVLIIMNAPYWTAKNHLKQCIDISQITAELNEDDCSAIQVMNKLDPVLRTHTQGVVQPHDLSLVCISLKP